ncbi:MAG: phosphoribosylformylglycinamidine cyclo-ligase [Candidatus Altiarchaeota archaeon]
MAEMTYAKAGVDIRKEDQAIKGMKSWIQKTFANREGRVGKVMVNIGGYANLIDLGSFALAFTNDGVGSKVLVAQELKKYDTIGIDLIAMNVNDLICVGAEPIALVDYLAMQDTNDDLSKEISVGLYEGAKQSRIAIVGGETASLPDVITGLDNDGFDLAGASIGIVAKDKIITGKNIQVGDKVIGFPSSGIHSNGLTLARKVLPKNMWMKILTPTRIYVAEVLEIIDKYKVSGLAHITGSGFKKMTRLTELGFLLDNLPEPMMIFKKIQELGEVSDEEMHRTFNMGIGFTIIANPQTTEKIMAEYGEKHKLRVIGSVVHGQGVVIRRGENEFII